MTNVLGIPLANEIPTPNARKTCALAIWLIQTQRLPAHLLMPARDRIAYALRRGIDGELGKEGKKGSTTDGLKVGLFPHRNGYMRLTNCVLCRLSMISAYATLRCSSPPSPLCCRRS